MKCKKRRDKDSKYVVAPAKGGCRIQKKVYRQETHRSVKGSAVLSKVQSSNSLMSRTLVKKSSKSFNNNWKINRVSPTTSLPYPSSMNSETGDNYHSNSRIHESFDNSDHSTNLNDINQSMPQKLIQMPSIDSDPGVYTSICLDNLNNPAEFHHLSGKRYLLVLRHPSRIYFRGTLHVTAIYGIACTLGFEFTPGMKSRLVFSPKGISALCLATTGQSHISDYKEMSSRHGIDVNIIQRLQKKDAALLIEPAFGEHWEQLFMVFSHVLKFNPLVTYQKERIRMHSSLDVERNLRVKFVQPGGHRDSKSFHSESIDWNLISQQVLRSSFDQGQVRLMVFGGKGVGKSTFIRFMVNKWLSQCQEKEISGASPNHGPVVFIDLDPGQSEFIPPGCISVTLVSEPLLGPNYTHLKDPERMICVGDLDVGKCPNWYMQCADDLQKFCSSNPKLRDYPWFINTMGFCRGIGADLSVKLIHLWNPTHVIQLQSSSKSRNFDPIDLLSWPSVNSWKGTDWNPQVSNKKGTPVSCYFYYQLPSEAERSLPQTDKKGNEETEDVDSQWGLPAWQSRDLSVLAYFSRMVSGPRYSMLAQKPHMLKLADLTLSLPSPLVSPHLIKTAFNARLVALCSHLVDPGASVLQESSSNSTRGESFSESRKRKLWDTILRPNIAHHPSVLFHMPFAPCLGFGIVRAIDNFNHELFLMTPLSKQKLALVDCLATSPSIGSVPKELFLKMLRMNPSRKFIPYVLRDDRSNPFARTTPRVYQPTSQP